MSEQGHVTAEVRLVGIAAIALAIGACCALAALVLLRLIDLFTNLFYFQHLALQPRAPADHALGWTSVLVPMLGGLIVGLMARYGSERIRGQVKCSSGLWRCHPDGSGLELLAWGLRNPYGLAFNEAGELYASDNDFEEKGERSIADDPDRIWHIKNAKAPHGSVTTPDWYGFPDICGDGLPAWHESHRPRKGKAAEPLLENPPAWAGPAAYLEEPHCCMTHLEFCRSDVFSHRGELFLAQFGTYAPLNTPDPAALNRGFRILCINMQTGVGQPFVRNREPGPASAHPGSAGLERPVDCKFHPDGRSLYVLDFGVTMVAPTHVVAYARTGVVWRVSRI